MTGTALRSLVLDELRRARLGHLRYEVKPNSVGLFVLIWSDLIWCEGVGGRKIFGRDESVRRREASIGVQVLHSRLPRITWMRDDGASEDLWLPTKCPAPTIAALVFHALAHCYPTSRRVRCARKRLRAAGVRASDFRTKPSLRRGAA